AEARARLDRLTKPPGSLGRLETIATQLAGITGLGLPRVERPAIIVFAGDHGVTAQGVSAYPSDVTAQMVANFVGGGAAINVLGRLAGAEVVVVDVGVAGAIPGVGTGSPGRGARLVQSRIADGTRDMTVEPAMTRADAIAAIEVGRLVVVELIASGVDLVAVGEMGIGNTTAASALAAVLTGRAAAGVTGRGTGLDEQAVRHKVAVIEEAIARHRPDPSDPLGTLAALGGLEIAALVGAILGAAEAAVPLVLDGFITGSAALVASAMAPGVEARVIASHASAEPGHRIVLERLGLRPLLDLELRLGEGSGAALAIPIVRAAAAILAEMATFDDAGVSGPATGVAAQAPGSSG
ncbi:MAG TPA: nicotinate-nucleotide--dimethylbenzimidazole phosphoribosyltransferase, partial [Candidatus Bathyarchaeia archaeon]|nr:nicotinate-nucleotide--dimethylbenzimidazole phosphoribosyltransferase [Candidatus Bathyarchaeia archaeon]